MKKSIPIKMLYVAGAVAVLILASSLFIAASEYLIRDEDGVLIHTHREPTGETYTVSSYVLDNGLSADQVDVAKEISKGYKVDRAPTSSATPTSS